MRKKMLLYILLIAFGASAFVLGEYDDSPGAQLIGVIVGIFGIRGIVKEIRKRT